MKSMTKKGIARRGFLSLLVSFTIFPRAILRAREIPKQVVDVECFSVMVKEDGLYHWNVKHRANGGPWMHEWRKEPDGRFVFTNRLSMWASSGFGVKFVEDYSGGDFRSDAADMFGRIGKADAT